MKSKHLIATLFAAGLLSGCVAQSPSADYCDIAAPLYFEHMATVDWLSDNDELLLRAVVVHNEQRKKLCG
jgi:hypothetical protein